MMSETGGLVHHYLDDNISSNVSIGYLFIADSAHNMFTFIQ